ncbi:hypothetical protein C8R48DRAFT_722699 [Suillus tomentosus]|nr:hypothetical protein C8R48DRAFT_722699 [Suillus tomentosus]
MMQGGSCSALLLVIMVILNHLPTSKGCALVIEISHSKCLVCSSLSSLAASCTRQGHPHGTTLNTEPSKYDKQFGTATRHHGLHCI